MAGQQLAAARLWVSPARHARHLSPSFFRSAGGSCTRGATEVAGPARCAFVRTPGRTRLLSFFAGKLSLSFRVDFFFALPDSSQTCACVGSTRVAEGVVFSGMVLEVAAAVDFVVGGALSRGKHLVGAAGAAPCTGCAAACGRSPTS